MKKTLFLMIIAVCTVLNSANANECNKHVESKKLLVRGKYSELEQRLNDFSGLTNSDGRNMLSLGTGLFYVKDACNYTGDSIADFGVLDHIDLWIKNSPDSYLPFLVSARTAHSLLEEFDDLLKQKIIQAKKDSVDGTIDEIVKFSIKQEISNLGAELLQRVALHTQKALEINSESPDAFALFIRLQALAEISESEMRDMVELAKQIDPFSLQLALDIRAALADYPKLRLGYFYYLKNFIKDNPQASELIFNLLYMYDSIDKYVNISNEQKVQEFTDWYLKLIDKFPNSDRARIVYIEYAKKWIPLDQLHESVKDYGYYLYFKAAPFYDSGEFDKAYEILNAALAQPWPKILYRTYARCFSMRAFINFEFKQKYDAALKDISSAIAYSPNKLSEYYSLRSRIRYKIEGSDAYKFDSDKADNVTSYTLNDYITELNALNDTKQYEKVQTLADEMIRLYSYDHRGYYSKARAYASTKQYEAALEMLNKALELFPNYVHALQLKGHVMEKLGNTDEAIVLYKSALEIDSNHRHALTSLGDLYRHLGRHSEAEMLLSKSNEVYSGNKTTVFAQAVSKLDQNDLLGAVPYAQEAFKIDPSDDNSYENMVILADKLIHQEEAYREAIELMEVATKLRPEHPWAFDTMSVALRESEGTEYYDLKSAIEWAQLSIDAAIERADITEDRMNKDLASPHLGIAIAYDELKQYKKAYTYAKKALNYVPWSSHYKETYSEIRKNYFINLAKDNAFIVFFLAIAIFLVCKFTVRTT